MREILKQKIIEYLTASQVWTIRQKLTSEQIIEEANNIVNNFFINNKVIITLDEPVLEKFLNEAYKNNIADIIDASKNERCNDCDINNLNHNWCPKRLIVKNNNIKIDTIDCYKFSMINFINSLTPKFKHCNFENYITNKQNELSYKKCLEYSNTLFAENRKNGILLMGNYGTGKTHLAISILKNLIKLYKTIDCNIISLSEMFNELKLSFDNKDSKPKIIKIANSYSVVAFDDIGAEKYSEWSIEQLYLIINKRYENELPTIFTTNLNIKELEEKIGKRIVSRIIEMCEIIVINGEDYRRRKIEKD